MNTQKSLVVDTNKNNEIFLFLILSLLSVEESSLKAKNHLKTNLIKTINK